MHSVSIKCSVICSDFTITPFPCSNSTLLRHLRTDLRESDVKSLIAIPILLSSSHDYSTSWPLPQPCLSPSHNFLDCLFLQGFCHIHNRRLTVSFDAVGPFVNGTLSKSQDPITPRRFPASYNVTLTSTSPIIVEINSYTIPSPVQFYIALCFMSQSCESSAEVVVNLAKNRKSRKLVFQLEKKGCDFVLRGSSTVVADTECLVALDALSVLERSSTNHFDEYLEEVADHPDNNSFRDDGSFLASDMESVSFISSINDAPLSIPREPSMKPLSTQRRVDIRSRSLLFPQNNAKSQSNDVRRIFEYFNKELTKINENLLPEVQQNLSIFCSQLRNKS
ncbi:hypothetical protein P9112_002443 [Eukaryota sp. TZLM1-RC]